MVHEQKKSTICVIYVSPFHILMCLDHEIDEQNFLDFMPQVLGSLVFLNIYASNQRFFDVLMCARCGYLSMFILQWPF